MEQGEERCREMMRAWLDGLVHTGHSYVCAVESGISGIEKRKSVGCGFHGPVDAFRRKVDYDYEKKKIFMHLFIRCPCNDTIADK